MSQDMDRLTGMAMTGCSVPDLEAIAQKAFILGRYAGVRQLAAYIKMMHSKNCALTPGTLDEASKEVTEAIKISDRKYVEYEDGERDRS